MTAAARDAGVDLARRVHRALYLTVERQPDGTWLVSGGVAPHRVVRTEAALTCDCADSTLRHSRCKHLIAVHFARVPAEIREALRELVGTAP